MTDFDPGYIDEVLADRSEIEWFSPEPIGAGALGGPADIYVRTEDGTVTWGWSIQGVPVDPGERRFRRLRHPEGWAILIDADEPEILHVPVALTMHRVTTDTGDVTGVTPAGAVPTSGDAYTLAKASDAGGIHRMDDAWPLEAVSGALALWVEAFLERQVTFVGRSPTDEELGEIETLVGPPPVPEIEHGPVGVDDEVADLIGDVDDVYWFQGDLTWPDVDDAEAFRDRVDVRIRDVTGTDSWLASIEPLDASPGSMRLLSDGGHVLLDPEDPSIIRLEWDRRVLAISRQTTGFEPAGVAVPEGTSPATDQWEELRRVLGEHEDASLIHAPAWSEGRVALALAEWATAWSGSEVRFIYDFDDPTAQAAIAANNALEHAAPPPTSVRTATQALCGHTETPISPLEDPMPCGRPATGYFQDGEEMELVCADHHPDGIKVSTLLRA